MFEGLEKAAANQPFFLVPFSWSKFGGGTEVEWVGDWLDLARFALGISAKRQAWVVSTLQFLVKNPHVRIRRFHEILGRLSFAVRALDTLWPFLGTLLAWVAALPGGACLELPKAIKLTLVFLTKGFERGSMRISALSLHEELADVGFRADAKLGENWMSWVAGSAGASRPASRPGGSA